MENQLVVLSTAAADAGRYYVQAVNEKNGENKTSPSIYLNVTGKQRSEGVCCIAPVPPAALEESQTPPSTSTSLP
ncbi:protein sidekick-1 isoform X1 [Tachysurus ichikawai]